jgi:hypothetical protein
MNSLSMKLLSWEVKEWDDIILSVNDKGNLEVEKKS